MRIDHVETFVVANPPPRHGGRYFIFVTLTTDSGGKGVGEAYVATFDPHLVARMIEDVADRWLIGQSPFDVESFWRRAYGSGYASRPDPTLCGVRCAPSICPAAQRNIRAGCAEKITGELGGRTAEVWRSP